MLLYLLHACVTTRTHESYYSYLRVLLLILVSVTTREVYYSYTGVLLLRTCMCTTRECDVTFNWYHSYNTRMHSHIHMHTHFPDEERNFKKIGALALSPYFNDYLHCIGKSS